jgi:FkbM family methyltransferase
MDMPWIDRLDRVTSPEALRRELAESVRVFSPRLPESLAIVGAGPEGERLADLCRNLGIRVMGLADDNPSLAGRVVGGLAVRSFHDLLGLDRSVPVVVATNRPRAPMRRLRGAGFENVVPFVLLQVLAPEQFPPHPFHLDLLERTWAERHALRTLAERLADPESKKVLDAAVGFRLTCEPEVPAPLVRTSLYDPPPGLDLPDDAVFVDAGAFRGDTVRDFMRDTKGRFGRIIAVEPDQGSARALAETYAEEPRVEVHPVGLHLHDGELSFSATASRSTRVDGSGAVTIPVRALDNLLSGERVDFIKMNIEGAEADALEGARNTIARWRPALAISIYHKPDDLVRLPALMADMLPGCKLFIRQYEAALVETVAWALP